MLALLALAPAANAVTLSVVPESASVDVGSTFIVDIMASGLQDGVAPSIGAFDLDLNYNPSLLSFNSVTFGSGLDVLGFGDIKDSGAITAGKVNAFEVSLDSVEELNLLQPGTFRLFYLTFNAVAAGTSALQLSVNALSDAAGTSLDATLQNGSVTVAPVPLPAGVWLLLSGLAGIGLIRTRRPADRLSIPGSAA